MRTYYIFKIKEILKQKANSYSVYKLLYNIYSKKVSYDEAKSYIYKYLDLYDKENISKTLTNLYSDDDFYSYRYLTHNYHDYFNNERTSLYINDAFIKVKTNKNLPSFFYDLRDTSLFVCDFENTDYFWITEINSKLLV